MNSIVPKVPLPPEHKNAAKKEPQGVKKILLRFASRIKAVLLPPTDISPLLSTLPPHEQKRVLQAINHIKKEFPILTPADIYALTKKAISQRKAGLPIAITQEAALRAIATSMAF